MDVTSSSNNSVPFITKPLYRLTQLVWYVLGILEILLLFRFLLRMFGANPDAGFTYFIYQLTGIMMAPFFNVFGTTKIENTVFEWTVLLAMFVYGIVAAAIVKLI